MAIDTAMKRFSMLNMAGGAVYPRLFEPDGAVDADDRAFLLRLYGGNAFSGVIIEPPPVPPVVPPHVPAGGGPALGPGLRMLADLEEKKKNDVDIAIAVGMWLVFME